MKILFLLTQDLDSPYGIGRFLPLSRELTALGNRVEAAALHPDFWNLKHKKIVKDGILVRYVGPMHVSKRGDHKTYYPAPILVLISLWATLKLTWIALISKVDIIHIAKPHPMNSLAGLAAKILKGKTLFLDYDDLEISSNRFKGKWQRSIVGFFENWTIHKVDHITTNTHFLRSRLIESGIDPTTITYIPNGVDTYRFDPPSLNVISKLKQNLNIEGKKIIAYIGSLSLVSHPIDILLHAFSEIYKNDPNTVLMIVGGGDSLNELKKLSVSLGIDEATIFVGRVKPDEIAGYYYVSDMIVDPINDDDTARGRCPLKLFESWVCDAVFITGDVGDRRLILGSPPAGYLVKPSDPSEIAKAIFDLLRHPAKAMTLIKRGQLQRQKYDWKSHADILFKVYQNFGAKGNF